MASSGSTERPAAHRTDFKYLLLTLYLPSISMGLGLGITVPVIPELTQQMGIQLEGAALVFVFQLLGTLAAPLPTGFLIDKLGRRRVLLAGPFVTAVASLLVARSLWRVRTVRSWSCWSTASSQGGRADVDAQPHHRHRRHGRDEPARQAGNADVRGAADRQPLWPGYRGVAAVVIGLWTPFVMHAVIVLIAVIPSFFVLRETAPPARPRQASASGTPPVGVWRHMTAAPIPAVFAVQFLANVTRGGVFGGGVIVVYASYPPHDLEPNEIGLLRGAMAAVAIPIVFTGGYVMDRFGRKYTIVPGLILSGASMIFLAVTASTGASFAVVRCGVRCRTHVREHHLRQHADAWNGRRAC